MNTKTFMENAALEAYGFDRRIAETHEALAKEDEVPARVVEERRGRYAVVRSTRDGLLSCGEAVVSGKLRHDAVSAAFLPAVGDWVCLAPGSRGPAIIRALLPRRSAFMRKAPGDTGHDRVEAQVIAANVDLALVVCAAGKDWKARRVERYLALAAASGAESMLVLTKADLAEDPDALLAEARLAAPGRQVAMICAPEGRGLGVLEAELKPGSTVALLGSSGAGKSTLLNALAGEVLANVNAVREDDERGRHTTTHRQLFRLASGALVIDTPGMRELQLWAGEDEVAEAFPEIDGLAAHCRFRDCRHEAEPGCAVRAALEAGNLDPARYAGWIRLQREVAFLRAREEGSIKETERRRWKGIEMSRRAFAKEARRREEM